VNGRLLGTWTDFVLDFFSWSRDAALTMLMIVDEFAFGNKKLQAKIEEYITAQAVLQTVSNPSGTFLPQGLGLGEPKYMVDGKRFNGAWGRPQRDGPALRAITLMTYSKWLMKHGQTKKVKNVIWPIISNDLSYVGQYWNQTGFDLWEEVNGSSFFTVQTSHRALAEGQQLARDLGVKCTGCDQAPQVLCLLEDFWNGEHFVANINTNIARTGLDGNSLVGPITVFDIDASCDSPTMQPCHSKTLSNFKALIDSFRAAYAINKDIPAGSGVAVGRYTEDVYYGGHPWYLLTTASAELLYDAVAQWKSQRFLQVDSTSLPFFKDLYPTIKTTKYKSGSKEFSAILAAVTTYADSFVAIAAKYIPADGSLSEQFNRTSGAPLSATHLTWSYAAFVTMSQRRSGNFPPSWGASKAASAPKTCASTSSTQGVYVPALAAGAPNVTVGCQILVGINLNASTYYGENIYAVGSSDDFGAWNIDNSYPLNPGGYTAERPLWTLSAYLPAGQEISYKYARQQNCGQPWVYESGNRTLTVPACGGKAVTIEDAWVGPVGTSGGC
jgi:glucoamylase